MGEARVVMVVSVTVRLKVDVGGELHGAIWKTVRHPMLALLVVGLGLVVLMAHKFVEALHAETLHLVARGLGGCLGLSHSCDDLGEDTAQDGLTFGVWRIWRDGNGLGGVKDELQNVGSRL